MEMEDRLQRVPMPRLSQPHTTAGTRGRPARVKRRFQMVEFRTNDAQTAPRLQVRRQRQTSRYCGFVQHVCPRPCTDAADRHAPRSKPATPSTEEQTLGPTRVVLNVSPGSEGCWMSGALAPPAACAIHTMVTRGITKCRWLFLEELLTTLVVDLQPPKATSHTLAKE